MKAAKNQKEQAEVGNEQTHSDLALTSNSSSAETWQCEGQQRRQSTEDMGCGGSAVASKETFSPENVPDVEEGYPPPTPPTSNKSQVFQLEDHRDIDERAKSVPRGRDSSYKNLVTYLTKGLTSDLQKVRAIFVWLGSQRIYDEDLGDVTRTDTPRGYMKLMQQKRGNYATFLALLCRAAGIPCAIIRGYGKSAHYEAGDRDLSSCLSSWNAVHVDGEWRLIHPLWAFTAVTDADGNTREGTDDYGNTQVTTNIDKPSGIGHNNRNQREDTMRNTNIPNGIAISNRKGEPHGLTNRTNRNDKSALGNAGGRTDSRIVARFHDRNRRDFQQESPNRAAKQNSRKAAGSSTAADLSSAGQEGTAVAVMTPRHQTSIDEDYFLTDPEHFIYVCRPFREEWQLLPQPWSMNEFLAVPYFQMTYFQSGLELVSTPQCRLDSEGGLGKVSFRVPRDPALTLTGSLLFNKAESSTRLPDDVYLSDHVIVSVEDDVRTVIARLPVKGIYKLSIFGGTKRKEHLCDFRLQCAESIHRGMPFPFQPEVGIGYGEAAIAAGLKSPSHFSSVLTLRPRESEELIFKSRDSVELRARMVHSTIASESLSDYVSAARVGKEIRVRVGMPDPGDFAADIAEFGVELEVRDGDRSEDFRNVLNFLVAVDGIEARTRNRKTLDTHPARMTLIQATEQSDIRELEAAIRRFQRDGLQDGGDLREAKDKLLYLHRVALTDAIEGRNLEELEDVIHRAESSAVLGHLRRCWELPEAEKTRDQLRRLKYFLHKILELNQQTISEVQRYQTPLPPVHDVMQATYLLLGEREENLVKWSYVQKLMRRTGRRSLIRRLQDFDVVRVCLSDAIRASSKLQGYDQFSVHQSSAGAGAFYVWCCSVIDEIQQQEADNLHAQMDSGSPRSAYGQETRTLSALTEEEGDSLSLTSRLNPQPQVSSRQQYKHNGDSVTSPAFNAERTEHRGGNSSRRDDEVDESGSDFVFSNFDGSPRQEPKTDSPKRSPREGYYYAG